MDDLPPKDCFLQSLERCLGDEAFIPAFYDRFLSSSEDIRSKFRNTDFEQQNKMLAQSLRLASGVTSGEPESLRELRERGRTHDRHHLNIEANLYKFWLEAVIETAQDFDDQWNSSIESAWRTTLERITAHMSKFY